jgi:hypothetical protein
VDNVSGIFDNGNSERKLVYGVIGSCNVPSVLNFIL